MPRNEAGLVAQIIRAVLTAHPTAWVFKTVGSPYQMSGVPDLVLSVEGRFIALEVKHQKPGESAYHARMRATPVQQQQIRAINRSGGVARLILSPDEALAAIDVALTQKREDHNGT